MANRTENYNEAVRANLPSGMTWDGRRYVYNNHKFTSYNRAIWYYRYLERNGGGGEESLSISSADGETFTITGETDNSVTLDFANNALDGTYTVPNTSAPGEFGWIPGLEPTVSGTPGAGNDKTVSGGMTWTDGSADLSLELQFIRDPNGAATVLGTFTSLPQTYTEQAGDSAAGGVVARITLNNGSTTSVTDYDLVPDGNAPAVVGSSTVAPVRIVNPDGDGKDYDVYTLTPSDTITFSQAGIIPRALIVSPGGGGSISEYETGGAGGGGYPSEQTNLLATSGTKSITGGLGGIGGTSVTKSGQKGQSITFLGITVEGGGTGFTRSNNFHPDINGVTGGGGGRDNRDTGGTGSLGGDGGRWINGTSSVNNSAGGGGAGGNGVDAPDNGDTPLPNGGDGLPSDITGSTVYYGGGGGGSVRGGGPIPQGGLGGGAAGMNSNVSTVPSDGVDGLGGGGGPGYRYFEDSTRTAGKGGDGAVILRITV